MLHEAFRRGWPEVSNSMPSQLHGRNATGAPPDRINAMAAFEPSARQLLLFGGNQSASRADLKSLATTNISPWYGPS